MSAKIFKQIPFNRILGHTVFWFLYIITSSLVYGLEGSLPAILRFATDHLLSLPLYLLTSYTTAYYLIPRFALNRKYILFSLLFILLMMGAGFLEIVKTLKINPLIMPETATGNIPFRYDLYGITRGAFFIFLPVISFLFVKFVIDWYSTQAEKAELERRHLRNELQLLKSQLHPHFLLTTLANLKRKAESEPLSSAPGIEQVAEILSFILYEFNTSTIELKKEIKLIRNYLDLQNLNYNGRIVSSISLSGNTDGIHLPPMLLFTVVEYVYTCVESREDPMKLGFYLDSYQKTIDFRAECGECPEILTMSNSDPGLRNLRKRMDLIFGDKSQIDLKQIGNRFILHLNFNSLSS